MNLEGDRQTSNQVNGLNVYSTEHRFEFFPKKNEENLWQENLSALLDKLIVESILNYLKNFI